MSDFSTNITEIFSSIQGEGPHLGQKQIFVRFSGCNLSCKYCDTDSKPRKHCKVYDTPDSFRKIPNPLSCEDLASEINKFRPELHHSISLTGGEPLLHAEFLKNFLENRPELNIYLETNGTLPEKLEIIAPYINIVSMDVKVPSSTGQSLFFREHAEFIKALDAFYKEFFIKIVVNREINEQEINQVKELLKTSRREVSLVLQPESNKDMATTLFALQNELLRDIKDVRIIPQMHKYLNLQ